MSQNSRHLKESLDEFEGHLSKTFRCVLSRENRIDDVFTYIENHLSYNMSREKLLHAWLRSMSDKSEKHFLVNR